MILRLFIIFSLFFVPLQATLDCDYHELTAYEKENFQKEMKEALRQSEVNLVKVMRENQKKIGSVPGYLEVKLQSASVEVKKVIVDKFMEAPSIKSPKVRNFVLNLLKKDRIYDGDIHTLQERVNEEKKCMGMI